MSTKKKVAARRASRSTSPVAIQVHERLTRLETLMETHVESTKVLADSVAELKTSLTKYKGFWGAITMIGGAIAALIGFVKEPLFKKLGLS